MPSPNPSHPPVLNFAPNSLYLLPPAVQGDREWRWLSLHHTLPLLPYEANSNAHKCHSGL